MTILCKTDVSITVNVIRKDPLKNTSKKLTEMFKI